MKKDNTYVIVLFSLLFGGILFGISSFKLKEIPKVQAQTVFEVQCPSGQAPWQPLISRNPNTGGIKQFGCVDLNGNLNINNLSSLGTNNGGVGISLQANGLLTPTLFAIANLPSATAFNGSIAVVSDSTVISTEGQNCTNGGSVRALAFASGGTWKCF